MPPRRPPPLGLDRRHRDGLVFGRWVRRVRLGRPFLLGLADFLVRLSLAFGHDRFLDGAGTPPPKIGSPPRNPASIRRRRFTCACVMDASRPRTWGPARRSRLIGEGAFRSEEHTSELQSLKRNS